MAGFVYVGNLRKDGEKYRGWAVGDHVDEGGPRKNDLFKVKLGEHGPGEGRTEIAKVDGVAVYILIEGEWEITCMNPDGTLHFSKVLREQFDYVIYGGGIGHTWVTKTGCIGLTFQIPSKDVPELMELLERLKILPS